MMKYCQNHFRIGRICIGLLLGFAPFLNGHSSPLINAPTMHDALDRLNVSNKTFLCFCDITQPMAKLDTTGCATKGRKAVIGNVIPKKMVLNWIPNEANIPQDHLNALMDEISRDPINIALFSDAVWEEYQHATSFTGTNEIGGQFGACPLKVKMDRAHIADGKLGEVARVALYLRDTYSIPIPKQSYKHFLDIHDMVLPSPNEIQKNENAYEWNGSWNSYVEPSRRSQNRYDQEVVNGVINKIYELHIK